MKIKDRPEFRDKPKPLSFGPDDTAMAAVTAMNERNVGSVMICDGNEKLIGVVTERDILNRLVARRRDPETTKLSEIMTANPRVARADDDLIDWMRIMSNERFRRLPIVDEGGRVVSIMTQGDFVSYTWPNLLHQAREVTRSSLNRNYQIVLVAGSVALYTIILVAVLAAFFTGEA
ncbi:cyclic nucleotide-binding/CBS domain-containing protein [Aurantimonas sp. VKM B-3413]|uniref:CBS domain-containing protein n=1 Tax=Aurantimonas sp. VKM B-3413 TaxID=2779401 RepID=UPI002107CE93|nr:CBS domain-containing protein [Aurantimonas sp. VKM B-3413]MCB8836619.1 CBS domain-containing protein [Aurantimonas sp. VKM B-3413]